MYLIYMPNQIKAIGGNFSSMAFLLIIKKIIDRVGK